MTPDFHPDEARDALRESGRINVVGTSGSGKSTFSRDLALALGLPYHEMDAHFWQAEWQGRSDDDFLARIAALTSGDAWVLDGNYTRTVPVKWARVECVVWLDYSLPVTFFRAVRRAIGRAISKKELWPGTGNHESFCQSFLSRKSILLWTLRTHGTNRRKYATLLQTAQPFKWIRIRRPRDTKALLDALRPPERTGHLGSRGRI
jgi:adenylate kinase family enzyme